MSRFQDLKDFLERRLLTAVIRDLVEGRTVSGYEEELKRQRKLLDVILIPEIKLHRADVELLMVKKEELPPEQQERSPYPDQEEKESPLIKEEEEEVWMGQGREQLQGLEEADTKFLFPSVHMKSENDEEKHQSSLLHHRLTEHMETAAGGEDCGRAEPARSSHPQRLLQPEIEVQTKTSSDTGPPDTPQTRDCLGKLNSATDKRAETGTSNNCPEPDKTNCGVSPTEIRPFSCSECGKCFKRKAEVGRHMFVHTKEKPHSCSECGKGFGRKENLTTHMLVHTKEKPHTCSECGARFSQKGNLRTHMLIHTKQKPHSCPECGKQFSQKGTLTTHMFVHTEEKPHSCPKCGKRFTVKATLMTHMFVHTNEKPYTCSECGKGFIQIKYLKKHTCYLTPAMKRAAGRNNGKGFGQKQSLNALAYLLALGKDLQFPW